MRTLLKNLAALSLMAAVLELSILVHLNGLIPLGFDYLVLLLYLILPYTIISFLVFAVLKVCARLDGESSKIYKRSWRYTLPATGYIFAVNILMGLLKIYYHDYPPDFRWVVFAVCGSVLLVVTVLFYLAWRYQSRLSSILLSIGLNLPRVAILFSLLVFFSFYHQRSRSEYPVKSHPGPGVVVRDSSSAKVRVILLGLDGVSWDSIERLSDEGRLPNLSALKENGSWGQLKTARPTVSPILWTSISTGKVESKHGIHDFKTTILPGVRPLKTTLMIFRFPSFLSDAIFKSSVVSRYLVTSYHYTSSMRSCKSLWNILSENGSSVGAVGWFMSWPAEKVNGYIVSDRTFLYPGGESDVDRGLTYPEDLYSEISDLIVDESTVTIDSLRWLCEPPERGGKAWSNRCCDLISDYLPAVRKNYSRDRTTLGISLHMLEQSSRCDVTMLYFRAVDSINHVVHHQIHECGDDRGDSLFFISDNYYEFVDRCVGRLVESLDEKSVLVILSDHGWIRGVGHPYAPDGVLILHGQHVKKGFRLEDASIYDITPTVLYLQGLPVAADMDGRPLLVCLDTDFTDNRPVEYIRTYETERKPGDQKATAQPLNSKVDNEIDEQLKALGYIE